MLVCKAARRAAEKICTVNGGLGFNISKIMLVYRIYSVNQGCGSVTIITDPDHLQNHYGSGSFTDPDPGSFFP